MTSLKFDAALVPLILSGEKTSTWRMFDDKNLSIGDDLTLIDRSTGTGFAQARIVRVSEKPIGEITEEDMAGHERYAGQEEMLETFRRMYGEAVTLKTPVKMVDFVLL